MTAMTQNEQLVFDALADLGQATMKQLKERLDGSVLYNTLRGAARRLRDKEAITLGDGGVYQIAASEPSQDAPAVQAAPVETAAAETPAADAMVAADAVAELETETVISNPDPDAPRLDARLFEVVNRFRGGGLDPDALHFVYIHPRPGGGAILIASNKHLMVVAADPSAENVFGSMAVRVDLTKDHIEKYSLDDERLQLILHGYDAALDLKASRLGAFYDPVKIGSIDWSDDPDVLPAWVVLRNVTSELGKIYRPDQGTHFLAVGELGKIGDAFESLSPAAAMSISSGRRTPAVITAEGVHNVWFILQARRGTPPVDPGGDLAGELIALDGSARRREHPEPIPPLDWDAALAATFKQRIEKFVLPNPEDPDVDDPAAGYVARYVVLQDHASGLSAPGDNIDEDHADAMDQYLSDQAVGYRALILDVAPIQPDLGEMGEHAILHYNGLNVEALHPDDDHNDARGDIARFKAVADVLFDEIARHAPASEAAWFYDVIHQQAQQRIAARASDLRWEGAP